MQVYIVFSHFYFRDSKVTRLGNCCDRMHYVTRKAVRVETVNFMGDMVTSDEPVLKSGSARFKVWHPHHGQQLVV